MCVCETQKEVHTGRLLYGQVSLCKITSWVAKHQLPTNVCFMDRDFRDDVSRCSAAVAAVCRMQAESLRGVSCTAYLLDDCVYSSSGRTLLLLLLLLLLLVGARVSVLVRWTSKKRAACGTPYVRTNSSEPIGPRSFAHHAAERVRCHHRISHAWGFHCPLLHLPHPGVCRASVRLLRQTTYFTRVPVSLVTE